MRPRARPVTPTDVRSAGHLGRQGAGQGHAGVRLVAPLRRAAHLHRRHAARGRAPRAPSSASRPRRSWTPATSCPTTSWSASSTSGSTSDDIREHGLHPRRLPPHRGPGRGARRDHSTADRPGGEPRRARGRGPRPHARAGGPCVDCGANLLGRAPPRSAGCDVCGGDVIQREDDTEEAINRRLDLYDGDRAAHRVVRRARPCC